MGLITITSDWGVNDHYLAAVKAKIYGYFPTVNILDITHQVPLFDIGKAAYFLRNVYPFSPDGTVHIIGVNDLPDSKRAHLIVCYHKQFFIGADNGIFSLLFPEKLTEVYEITEMPDNPCSTFPCRDLFAKVAACLAAGTPPDKLGKPAQILNLITPSSAIARYGNMPDGQIFAEIVGEVTYVDRYENVNTNIHRSLFDSLHAEFTYFEIDCAYPIRQISRTYTDVGISDELALFAGDGYLQIALNKEKAASLLRFKPRMAVMIRFWD